MSNGVTNILIVGVGGQGTLLASKILGEAAMRKGYDAKQSEVHGMAQRGGSVVTFVRFGPKVYSPIVDKGEADIVLAFEKLEALRWVDYLKKDGIMIVNDQEILPLPVITGQEKYPENALEILKSSGRKVIVINALEKAKALGEPRAVNVILIGVLAKYLDFTPEELEEALKEVVPAKIIDINLKAFREGLSL